MGSNNASHIMTLVNSIIGVSILAMPFCYKQCGILLATLVLIFSNLMTRLSCHYLLKSAIMTRRRTFEFLAFHTFGNSGKTTIELSIILLMVGTCIAFFVVMGDLGPAIIGPILQVEYSAALRPAVLIGIAVCVVLPLGLLRNVDSLSTICTASFLFYLLLVLKVFFESMDNLFSLSWLDEVHYWRPAGLLQCLPIFSMALSCQTQLLEIFDSVQNGTLDKMNLIVKYAVNLCTLLYIAVGFLGYVAYFEQPFSGNLLMSFSASNFSEFVKLGFVLSVAVTFPMVIFPCRTSLHSLLFKRMHTPHYELVSGGGNHIPEAQFKCITFFIITCSLIVGLLAPNIEIVLGLLGSTIGVIICVLCPPLLFISISSKATTEKVLAQMMCVLGFFIMFMGTYANLWLSESSVKPELQTLDVVDTNIVNVPQDIQSIPVENNVENMWNSDLKNIQERKKDNIHSLIEQKKEVILNKKNGKVKSGVEEQDQRIEPPIPMYPEANKELKAENINDIKNNEHLKREERISASSQSPSKSNDKQNLLSNQKEVLQNIREASLNIVKNDKSVKNVEEESKRNLEKQIEIKNKEINEKIVNELEALKKVDKIPAEQPPLPLLKAQNSASVVDKKTLDIQEDSQKNVNVDREKRDLDFVENLFISTSKDGEKKIKVHSADSKNELEIHPVPNYEMKSRDHDFVKNVGNSANTEFYCEKHQLAQQKEKLPTSAKASVPTTFSKYYNNETIKSSNSKIVDSEKLSNDVYKAESQKNVSKDEANYIMLSDPQLLVQNGNEGKVENVEKLKENFILSPSKLSNPSLVLQHELYADGKKIAIVNNVKPMLRDLKTISDKDIENRKK